MSKLIEPTRLSINWWANCGNYPDITIHVKDEDEYSGRNVARHIIPLTNALVLLVGSANGYAHYGIYSADLESNREYRPFWSKGTDTMSVYRKGDVTQMEVYGYGASRATFVNTFIKDDDKSIFDVGICGRYNMAGAVTCEFIHKKLAPLAAQQNVYLIAVRKVDFNQPTNIRSENEQLRVYPSLSKTEIVFPSELDIEWKQKDMRKEFQVIFAFGEKDLRLHKDIAADANSGTIGKEVIESVKLS